MTRSRTARQPLQGAQFFLGALAAGLLSSMAVAQNAHSRQPQHHAAPIERRPPEQATPPLQPRQPPSIQPQSPQIQPQPNQTQPNTRSQGYQSQTQQPSGNSQMVLRKDLHLSQWMDAHRNLPLDQQQKALTAEPGFRNLQPQVQQRMHDRLTELNSMAPDRRQQYLSRTEQMERLAPSQRQQIRGAMQQLGSLPEDRRRLVARTFRAVTSMPPAQRSSYLSSPQFRSQFSDSERSTLNNLLTVAPILPQSPPQAPR